MEFIQNAGEGERIHKLNDVAVPQADAVSAAVAYVTDAQSLIAACGKYKKQLTLYARYDYSGPVSHEVLDWFLQQGTQNATYRLRLVGDIFHPKVIWWHGVGVYLGSGNLTKSAWAGNVEAGLFLSEQELDDNNLRAGLKDFFKQTHAISHSLTKEIADQMVKFRSGGLSKAEAEARREFEMHRLIPRQTSLVSITKRAALDKARASFLKEWFETLQLLRDIGIRASEHKPAWIPAGTSPGVVADQFLHAYYYNQVRDGQTYPYPDLFRANENQREEALQKALEWWRQLPTAPSGEDDHITNWAPKVRNLLTEDALRHMTDAQFQELCLHVHSVRDHARQVANTTLGLQTGMARMPKDERTKVFARYLYPQRSQDGSTTSDVIRFVLYGGGKEEIPDRLFSACHNEDKKVPHLGISALGEMIGWALPDDFPPRNGRTSKALTALGNPVVIHSE